MAERGFAAIPVVDDSNRLVGIVAEADVLRDRIPADPRLHLLRGHEDPGAPHPLLVHGVMTVAVRSVEASADISDVARLFVARAAPQRACAGERRRGGHRDRRDVLRAMVRPDDDIRDDVLHLVEEHTGAAGAPGRPGERGPQHSPAHPGPPDVSTGRGGVRARTACSGTVAGVVTAQVLTEEVTPA